AQGAADLAQGADPGEGQGQNPFHDLSPKSEKGRCEAGPAGAARERPSTSRPIAHDTASTIEASMTAWVIAARRTTRPSNSVPRVPPSMGWPRGGVAAA